MHRLRRHSDRLARISAGLFVLVWLTVVATPCAIAMQFGQVPADHDCPHCPPAPCHEIEPADCNVPDSLDSPRMSDKSPQLEVPLVRPPMVLFADQPDVFGMLDPPSAGPPHRPPPYLLTVRFKE
jgi:hypothetical protein